MAGSLREVRNIVGGERGSDRRGARGFVIQELSRNPQPSPLRRLRRLSFVARRHEAVIAACARENGPRALSDHTDLWRRVAHRPNVRRLIHGGRTYRRASGLRGCGRRRRAAAPVTTAFERRLLGGAIAVALLVHARDAKVAELDAERRGQQEVCGLDVAVHDRVRVEILDRLARARQARGKHQDRRDASGRPRNRRRIAHAEPALEGYVAHLVETTLHDITLRYLAHIVEHPNDVSRRAAARLVLEDYVLYRAVREELDNLGAPAVAAVAGRGTRALGRVHDAYDRESLNEQTTKREDRGIVDSFWMSRIGRTRVSSGVNA